MFLLTNLSTVLYLLALSISSSFASAFAVMGPAHNNIFDSVDLELSEWIIHIIIGGILMVGVIVSMFLRKSKTDLDKEWEEEL